MPLMLFSPTETGIYKEYKDARGKIKQELIWDKCYIVNLPTGEVISKNIMPKFEGFSYDSYLRLFRRYTSKGEIPPIRFLEPMYAFEPDEFEDQENSIAEIKKDGHRCVLYVGTDCNRIFSKHISKKTGWFSENSDQVPHIRDLQLSELYGTVLDGEITWGKFSNLQSVMGALPHTAIQNQFIANEWAVLNCFDIFYYKGINIQKMPLIKRKEYLNKVIRFIHKKYHIDFVDQLSMYCTSPVFNKLEKNNNIGNIKRIKSFPTLFEEKVSQGEEGIIVKDLHGIYEQGKHSRAFLKLKEHRTWDCVFMGLTEPTEDYDGKKLSEDKMSEWPYWKSYEDDIFFSYEDVVKYGIDEAKPISKPYAMGWCGGIIFGVWRGKKLVEVGVAKGLSEEMMQDLKENWEEYVDEHRVVEIMAQNMIDKKIGSLRHPRFFKWRDDVNHDKCTWEKHISG